MTEKERLIELLAEDWSEMTYGSVEGFEWVDTIERDSGRWMRYMTVITKTPSGLYYSWEYEEGLTEEQESSGPGEYGAVEVIPVQRHETLVPKVEWIPVA